MSNLHSRRKLSWTVDRWPLKVPFVTAKESVDVVETVTVSLECSGRVGRGEALGVDYLGETPDSIGASIESLRPAVEAGANRTELLRLPAAAGARNAIDCALWDLESRLSGTSVWERLGVERAPVACIVTLPLADPADMAAAAIDAVDFDVLKLKLGNDDPVAVCPRRERGTPGCSADRRRKRILDAGDIDRDC